MNVYSSHLLKGLVLLITLCGYNCMSFAMVKPEAEVGGSFIITNCTGSDLYMRIKAGPDAAYDYIKAGSKESLYDVCSTEGTRTVPENKELFILCTRDHVKIDLEGTRLPLRIKAWIADKKDNRYCIPQIETEPTIRAFNENKVVYSRLITVDQMIKKNGFHNLVIIQVPVSSSGIKRPDGTPSDKIRFIITDSDQYAAITPSLDTHKIASKDIL